jgi:RpiB/LacA/LacB family sugar-phosphate isomerase
VSQLEIAIGSDHAGVKLKKEIIEILVSEGYNTIDCGTYSEESVDYPDIAKSVAEQVIQKKILGILICGTGIGISIAANKIPGIRAALCQDQFTARLAREHNDANILAIGARITGSGLAAEIVKTFIKSSFAEGRHQRRVEKINLLENINREKV